VIMFLRKLGQRTTGVVICVAMLLLIGSSVFAAESHEDPEAAETVFSGIALLRYYSGALDYVLAKNSDEVESRLRKMPFANIPQDLEESAGDFQISAIKISNVVEDIDEDMDKFRVMIEQYSVEGAIELASRIFVMIFQANDELVRIEQAIETTGEELEIVLVTADSDLRRSYDEILERINNIREMLVLYGNLLLDLLQGVEDIEEFLEDFLKGDITLEEFLEELLKRDITLEEFLKTDVTLEVQPTAAFVGDFIHFKGVLSSNNEPLAGREVDILLNSSRHITVQTDSLGNYQGSLQMPYWYIPELNLQALYYPKGEDISLYLSSLSPVIKLEILFYEAELEVTVENQAYPGLETMVTGRFDYGPSPPPDERRVEIYLDNVLIAELSTQQIFVQSIEILPETYVGKHIITVSSKAMERYSPVLSSAVLNVTKAIPILDIIIPKVAFIPGSVALEGNIRSEIGTLNEASIIMGLGESKVEVENLDDGSFSTEIKMGMGFGLVGSQDLAIQIFPQEPWHAPLKTTRTVLVVNFMNCGILLIIIIVLGTFLSVRLRRLITSSRKILRPATTPVPVDASPVYSNEYADTSSEGGISDIKRKPRNKIIYWYRSLVRLIQKITKIEIKPQQTHREFASESSGALGPIARLFLELTRRVERLIYSKYKLTKEDIENSQQLVHAIEENLKSESV